MGQLGHFEERPWSEGRRQVDEAQRRIAGQLERVEFVSSEGLEDKGDLTHFSAEAARELGRRFAEIMMKLQEEDQ